MPLLTLITWEDATIFAAIASFVALIVGFIKNFETVFQWIGNALFYFRLKHFNNKLWLHEKMLFTFFDLMEFPIWLTGTMPNGEIGAIAVSDALCEIVGLPKEKILGKGWMSAVHTDYNGVIKAWDDAIEKKTSFNYKWAFIHENNDIVCVQGKFHPVFYKNVFKFGLGMLKTISEEELDKWKRN